MENCVMMSTNVQNRQLVIPMQFAPTFQDPIIVHVSSALMETVKIVQIFESVHKICIIATKMPHV